MEALLKPGSFRTYLSIPFSFCEEVRARRLSPLQRRTRGSEDTGLAHSWWYLASVLTCMGRGAFSLSHPLLLAPCGRRVGSVSSVSISHYGWPHISPNVTEKQHPVWLLGRQPTPCLQPVWPEEGMGSWEGGAGRRRRRAPGEVYPHARSHPARHCHVPVLWDGFRLVDLERRRYWKGDCLQMDLQASHVPGLSGKQGCKTESPEQEGCTWHLWWSERPSPPPPHQPSGPLCTCIRPPRRAGSMSAFTVPPAGPPSRKAPSLGASRPPRALPGAFPPPSFFPASYNPPSFIPALA